MTSKNGASMAFGWIHRRQVTNKFEGADAGDGRGAPGILLALENIRWLVFFIPRQNIYDVVPQITLLQNPPQWLVLKGNLIHGLVFFYGFVFKFVYFIVKRKAFKNIYVKVPQIRLVKIFIIRTLHTDSFLKDTFSLFCTSLCDPAKQRSWISQWLPVLCCFSCIETWNWTKLTFQISFCPNLEVSFFSHSSTFTKHKNHKQHYVSKIYIFCKIIRNDIQHFLLFWPGRTFASN